MEVSTQTYQIPASTKGKFAILMGLLVVIMIVLETMWVARVPAIVFVGFGVFFYFTGISTATLTANALSVKPTIGRARIFSFQEGTFEVKTQTGFLSYLSSLKPEAKVLLYTKNGGKPVMVLNGLYRSEDVEAIYAEIQKRS